MRYPPALLRLSAALFLALSPLLAYPGPARAQTPVPTSTPTPGYVLAPCEWVILGEWFQFGGPWWEAIHGTDLWQTWDGNVITSHDFEGINVDSPPWGLYCDLTEVYNTNGVWPTEVFVETSAYYDNGNPNTGYYGVHPDYSSFQLGGFYQDYDGWAASIVEAGGIRQIAWTTSGVGAYIDMLRVYIREEDAEPTPTPAPTTTPAALSGACIPADTLPGPAPTLTFLTPTPWGTPTAGPTATPGTPTPTPTPPPSTASYYSLTDFSNTLSPWTSNGLAAWASGAGPDTAPGIAVLPFTEASTVATIGEPLALGAAPADALIFEAGDLPRPYRLVADAGTTADIPAGLYVYLQWFEWRDSGLGSGSWYLIGNSRINRAWATVTAASTSAEPVRAVAVRAVIGASTIDNPLGFIPVSLSTVAGRVDNLRVAAGASKWSSTQWTGLPVCSGGVTPPGGSPDTKICAVEKIGVNVFNCPRPEDWLAIGEWINYLWCNVEAYFTFGPANADQITDMRSVINSVEPFGSMVEAPEAFGKFVNVFRDIDSEWGTHRYWVIDWSQYTDWSAIETAPTFQYPPTSEPVSGNCDLAGFRGLSGGTALATCYVIEKFRQTSILGPIIQFLIWVASAYIAITYVRGSWLNSGGSTDE